MSHYDIISILKNALAILGLFSPLTALAAYLKGCSNTWRAADEIAQVEPLFPLPVTEPQPIILHSSITWEKITANCQICQDESEQAS
jgi:hypothetical protein